MQVWFVPAFFGSNPEVPDHFCKVDTLMPEANKPDELSQFASDLQQLRRRAIKLHLDAIWRMLDRAIRVLDLEIARDAYGSNHEAARGASQQQTEVSANGAGLVRAEGVEKRLGLHKTSASCPGCGSDGTRNAELRPGLGRRRYPLCPVWNAHRTRLVCNDDAVRFTPSVKKS